MQNKFLCRLVQFFVKIGYYFFRFPKAKVVSGEGSFISIPDLIKEDGLKKPLIVTDNSLMKLGLVNPLMDKLKDLNMPFAVFSDVQPNPTCENVMNGYEVYKSENCDCIVAVGGGSPMDTAKTIGAKAARPKKDIRKFLGLFSVRKKIPMLYAVPTTAGTGSEATLAAVITDEKKNHKIPICDPVLMPRRAILEPRLTEGLPPFMTATTGMDALCHAVEAYTNHTYCTKLENELAEKAIKLIHDNILTVFHDGHNLEARKNMQLAAMYAGRAFSRGSVGYVHAIGHTLGGLYHISHGEAMSVILPKVMRKYGKSAYKRLTKLAVIVGIEGKDDSEKANKFIDWIEETNKEMNIRTSFEQIRDEDIDTIVKWAIKEANPIYPCPQVWKYKDFEKIVLELKAK
ncbi:MAG: iron-containing alcohol dehydrogenase [Bacilli bacterium]|nr:iron-containing alcohol dehydrogenase [Bacilli bacterium]